MVWEDGAQKGSRCQALEITGAVGPGERGGDFQGPLVLTEEWEGCPAVREARVCCGFWLRQTVRG